MGNNVQTVLIVGGNEFRFPPAKRWKRTFPVILSLQPKKTLASNRYSMAAPVGPRHASSASAPAAVNTLLSARVCCKSALAAYFPNTQDLCPWIIEGLLCGCIMRHDDERDVGPYRMIMLFQTRLPNALQVLLWATKCATPLYKRTTTVPRP